MLRVEARLWMFATEEGGLREPLRLPTLALLLEPAIDDFRRRAGQDYFGVRISDVEGADLAPSGERDAELMFLADEARPWIEVGGEFHLDIPPRRVGRGRVIQVLEDSAGAS